MKTIVNRKLDLTVKYILTDKKYIPIEQSAGAYCCENCGKLIANIATIKNPEDQTFNIGFDCLETILINNNLLSGFDLVEYEKVKKMIPKVLRFSKTIKETLTKNNITGLLFEKPSYTSEFFTFYWLLNGATESRNNDYVKLKEMDFAFLIETVKNIFPKLAILTK